MGQGMTFGSLKSHVHVCVNVFVREKERDYVLHKQINELYEIVIPCWVKIPSMGNLMNVGVGAN
jgi:hypothetical protein